MVLLYRKEDDKIGSFTFFTDCGDQAVMFVGNFFCYGQPNTSTIIFLSCVEALKKCKYFVLIFFIKANTVIHYRNTAVGSVGCGCTIKIRLMNPCACYSNDRAYTGF